MKASRIRHALAVSVALGVVLAANGCGSTAGEEPGQGTEKAVRSNVRIVIGSGVYATQMGTYIAKEKGYFAEEGITNVEVVSSGESVAGLIGNSVDIALDDTVSFLNGAHKSKEPIKVTGIWWEMGDEILAANAESGIKTPQELIGKTVTAGPLGGQDEYILRKILKSLDVDASKVNIVPLTGRADTTLFQALMTNRVDAALIYGRHRSPVTDAGGVLLYDKPNRAPQEAYGVMEKMVTEDRPTLVAFLKAELKARKFAKDPANKEEVLKIMEKNGFTIGDLERKAYEGYIPMVSPDGGFDVPDMQTLIDLQKQVGLADKNLDWRQYVDLGPLHEAQKANDLAPRPASLN